MAAASRSVASSGDKNIAREEKGREGDRIFDDNESTGKQKQQQGEWVDSSINILLEM